MTTHQQAEKIAAALAALAARPANGCVLVALDGRAGAGKSTLAAVLSEHLGGPGHTAVVHGDDFFRPMPLDVRLRMEPVEAYDRYFAWQRLRDEVLAPLAAGRTAHYAPYRTGTDTLAYGEPRRLPAAGTVIVEGVLTARPELAAFYGLTVFVDTPREICLRRLHRRGRGPERDAWVEHWRTVEEFYLTTTRLPGRAGLTVRWDTATCRGEPGSREP